MKSVSWLSVAVFVAACGPSNPHMDASSIDTPTTDGPGDSAADGFDACLGASTIAITTPAASMIYTNGSVMLQATVSGCPLQLVDFEVDGMPTVRSIAAPYTLTFDTMPLTEGMHMFTFAGTSMGGMRVTSAPLTLVVDRTAPTIVMRSPMNGATNVAFRRPLSLTFSEAIDTAAVTPARLVYSALSPAAMFTSTFMWSSGNTQLTITPTTAPPFPNTVGISSFSGVRDLAGNAMMENPWTWSDPAWVQLATSVHGSTTGAGTNAVLRLRADGTPVLVYSSNASTGDQLNVATWSGTAWTPLGTPHANAAHATIADFAAVLDSTSNPDVVWSENDGSGNAMYAAHFDGTTWQPLGSQPINVTAGSAAVAPSAALDGAGHLFAAWSESALLARVPAVRRWDGTAWATVTGGYVPLPSGEVFADVPEVAVDGSGNVWLATLSRHSTGPFHLYMFEASAPGTSWFLLGSGQADPNSANDEHMSLVLDSHGFPEVAWTVQNIAGGTQIATTSWNGSSFATEPALQSVGTGASAHAHNPWRRITSTGSPVVAWIENGAMNAVIFTSSAWMPYEPALMDSGTQPANRLTGDLDRFDQASMAWTRSDPAGSGMFDVLVRIANR